MKPPKLFISYSHKDEVWKNLIATQLGVLTHEAILDVWDDRRIAAGDNWLPEIESAIQSCDLALLLISADFLTSNFILKQEVPRLLQRRADAGIRVIPLILRPCAWTRISWLAVVQARPKDGKPLSSFSENGVEDELASLTQELPELTALRAPAPQEGQARNVRERTGIHGHIQSVTATRPNSSSGVRVPWEDSPYQPSRLRHGAGRLVGREPELAALDKVQCSSSSHVLVIVAWAGVGKTSLVIEWMARQAAAGWRTFERVFDWSFYSQGFREQGTASADPFISAALHFFGDSSPAQTERSRWDLGAHLAHLVAQRPTLLVLDGLEPLQHPPGPQGGDLKDPALVALLLGLAQINPGLCIVTTREGLSDLDGWTGKTVTYLGCHDRKMGAYHQLSSLSSAAGVELLRSVDVHGSEADLQKLVEEVAGHALTLSLLGRYLVLVHKGDVRERTDFRFDYADGKIQGGHAFKVISAYERWFSSGNREGQWQLALLRMLSLFDRPASKRCLDVLRRRPGIQHLTEPIVGISDNDWNLTITRLQECGLILCQTRSAHQNNAACLDLPLETHTLVHDYFARKVRQRHLVAWRQAHHRLYEYLKTVAEARPDTLEGLRPLYEAVTHGCQAGQYEDAFLNVYHERILRGTEGPGAFFSTKKLGAFGADLAAVACFFDHPWKEVVRGLSPEWQAWLLNAASFRLRALGRLVDAVQPLRVALEQAVRKRSWKNASRDACNLSELELTLGQIEESIGHGRQAVAFADRSGEHFESAAFRATLGDALNQSGKVEEAELVFKESESMQLKHEREHAVLYSMEGFQYCDFLLGRIEPLAWCCYGANGCAVDGFGQSGERTSLDIDRCRQIEQRALGSLQIDEKNKWLLDIALDHLILGRVALCQAVIEDPKTPGGRSCLERARLELCASLDGLRRAASQEYIARGLLSHAWLRFLEGDGNGAKDNLDEAFEIAERGPMRLIVADIYLYRARLFHAVKPYPWNAGKDLHQCGNNRGPRDDVTGARTMIEQCGYSRRKQELEDAEHASEKW